MIAWVCEGMGKWNKYRRYGPFTTEAEATATAIMQKLKDSRIYPMEVKHGTQGQR